MLVVLLGTILRVYRSIYRSRPEFILSAVVVVCYHCPLTLIFTVHAYTMTDLRTSSISPDDDNFERDLQEMLEDGPNLNEITSNVQGGTPQSVSATFVEKVGPFSAGTSSSGTTSANNYGSGPSGSRLTRSYTLPPATSNVPLSNSGSHSSGRSPNGDFIPKSVSLNAQSKIETLKEWSVNTFKTTKQFISERIGKATKTVDVEMETSIEALRETQRKYANILRLARAMTSHFYNVVQTQKALGEGFSELAQKSPELQEEFIYNCETQRTLVKNGEILLGALNFFTSSVNTLCHKTMEDTLLTVKHYEMARLQFDAYRADYESLESGPREAATQLKLEETKRKYEEHKVKFDRLRSDVQIKLRFLDENRIKVMHKQLLLFHNAVSAYFSGNASALEATLKQFNIQLKRPNAEKPSWIES
ncbi:arfaptin-2-like isoform X1 [Biomphalaria glabrata]|uniref:Arfaptin-2-like isoform X1 n=1 Tax=Biomphalaria glabrata TaxID=6526 RepID=A0A9U8EIS4_BIOGL|nr:arfaptin-2-like isoform X1 [Biomphalaria glabrata]